LLDYIVTVLYSVEWDRNLMVFNWRSAPFMIQHSEYWRRNFKSNGTHWTHTFDSKV